MRRSAASALRSRLQREARGDQEGLRELSSYFCGTLIRITSMCKKRDERKRQRELEWLSLRVLRVVKGYKAKIIQDQQLLRGPARGAGRG